MYENSAISPVSHHLPMVFIFYVLAWLMVQPGIPFQQSCGSRLIASSKCDHSHVWVCSLAQHEEIKQNHCEVLCNYMQNFHKLSDTKQRPYQL
jgi:hypothetical protein